jgi:hypothetical protein
MNPVVTIFHPSRIFDDTKKRISDGQIVDLDVIPDRDVRI